jgi:prepilin-type processing-associated H-X9-DG protein
MAESAVECKHRMKLIGDGIRDYADTRAGRFPTATVRSKELPAEERLSWYAEIWPYLIQTQLKLEKDKAWYAEENRPPTAIFGDQGEKSIALWQDFRCPGDGSPGVIDNVGITNYVGISGIGGDYATTLPISDPWAGLFGYDRVCREKDIDNGLSNTMAVAETLTDNGPWTAGGRPTVRGLEQNGPPYLGKEGQFNSGHYTLPFTWTKHSYTTNILFADGSVRPFTEDMDPKTFEAMACIHGAPKANPDWISSTSAKATCQRSSVTRAPPDRGRRRRR